MAGISIKKPANIAVTIINKASQIASIVAVVFLVAMMVLTVADVFLRFFFHTPIQGTVELIQYFMVVAGFLGVAWCAIQGGHLKVDVFVKRLPPRVQAIIDLITLVMAMTVVPLVAWWGFSQAGYEYTVKTVSDITEIPTYPFYIVIGLGYALLFLVLVKILVEIISKVIKK